MAKEAKPCATCLFEARDFEVWDDCGSFKIVRMCGLCALSWMGQDIDVREVKKDEPDK